MDGREGVGQSIYLGQTKHMAYNLYLPATQWGHRNITVYTKNGTHSLDGISLAAFNF